MKDTEAPGGLLVVVDATRLYQGLYLVEQLLEMQLPLMVALTMVDVAKANGVSIDIPALQKKLGGVSVIAVTATAGQGLEALKKALASLSQAAVPQIPESWPELSRTARSLASQAHDLPRMDVIQGLLHPGSEMSPLPTPLPWPSASETPSPSATSRLCERAALRCSMFTV